MTHLSKRNRQKKIILLKLTTVLIFKMKNNLKTSLQLNIKLYITKKIISRT